MGKINKVSRRRALARATSALSTRSASGVHFTSGAEFLSGHRSFPGARACAADGHCQRDGRRSVRRWYRVAGQAPFCLCTATLETAHRRLVTRHARQQQTGVAVGISETAVIACILSLASTASMQSTKQPVSYYSTIGYALRKPTSIVRLSQRERP